MPTEAIPQILPVAKSSPFDLDNRDAYRQWREWKLQTLPHGLDALRVSIGDPRSPTEAEIEALAACCRRSNMAIFTVEGGIADAKSVLPLFASHFGLNSLDVNPYADEEGISALRVLDSGHGADYIPYTNRRLSWHTDGYYNPPNRLIRAMLIYCERAAALGGESLLLDHDLIYMQLRDRDSDLVAALMEDDVMCIPANDVDPTVTRGDSGGPVFSVDPWSGALHMRFTSRTRSIRWKADDRTQAALGVLRELITDQAAYVFRHRLRPGEGLLCNNVLHRRTAFSDPPGEPGRLVYRARYRERIAGT